MTMVLHSPQVHGFFSVPTDPLTSRPVFKRYFQERDLSSAIVVAPDMGHANSAARFAKDLNLPVTAGNKARVSDSEVRISEIVGQQVSGYKRALIFDDEIATGGSILELSRILIAQGVQEIWIACTHGVFVKDALEKLAAVPQITVIATTDTVRIPTERRSPKLQVLPVAHVFGDAIRRNYLRQSIGDLYVFGDETA
jgi:ribose-phosphate pyrophosphokinase